MLSTVEDVIWVDGRGPIIVGKAGKELHDLHPLDVPKRWPHIIAVERFPKTVTIQEGEPVGLLISTRKR